MGKSSQNLSGSEQINPAGGEISFVKDTWGSLRNAIIGCSAAVVFGLVVLLMSILSVTNPSTVFPQELATPAAEIYYLPYPGILPDSPLYRLKAVRDRVRLWLTFNRVKKAQAELLYADKRINAAQALVEGGKASLGVTTATKAEKYLQRTVERTLAEQKTGADVKNLLATLAKAGAKHAQILQDLQTKTSGEARVSLETTLKLTQMLQEKVAQAWRE